MSGTTENTPMESPLPLDREKWESEKLFRDREIRVKEVEQEAKLAELDLKRQENASGGWRSPLVVSIFAASIAAIGNAVVTYLNAQSQIKLETVKSEQARILEMIKTGNPDKAAENLSFLLESGLISNEGLSKKLQVFLSSRTPGTGPSLPSLVPAKDATELLTKFGGVLLKPQKDPMGQLEIGIGHRITNDEMASGVIVIDGNPVKYADGITTEQAQKLANQDLEPWRNQIKAMVSAPLSQNQVEALASLAYNIGIGQIKKSQIPALINAGRYDEVPTEIMKFSKVGGREFPGLVKRRQAEVALWNKK